MAGYADRDPRDVLVPDTVKELLKKRVGLFSPETGSCFRSFYLTVVTPFASDGLRLSDVDTGVDLGRVPKLGSKNLRIASENLGLLFGSDVTVSGLAQMCGVAFVMTRDPQGGYVLRRTLNYLRFGRPVLVEGEAGTGVIRLPDTYCPTKFSNRFRLPDVLMTVPVGTTGALVQWGGDLSEPEMFDVAKMALARFEAAKIVGGALINLYGT